MARRKSSKSDATENLEILSLETVTRSLEGTQVAIDKRIKELTLAEGRITKERDALAESISEAKEYAQNELISHLDKLNSLKEEYVKEKKALEQELEELKSSIKIQKAEAESNLALSLKEAKEEAVLEYAKELNYALVNTDEQEKLQKELSTLRDEFEQAVSKSIAESKEEYEKEISRIQDKFEAQSKMAELEVKSEFASKVASLEARNEALLLTIEAKQSENDNLRSIIRDQNSTYTDIANANSKGSITVNTSGENRNK